MRLSPFDFIDIVNKYKHTINTNDKKRLDISIKYDNLILNLLNNKNRGDYE
jgi:hypothetical protein